MDKERGRIIRAKKRFELTKAIKSSDARRATDAELFQEYIKALDNGLASLEAQRKLQEDINL